jgi:predicted peptidase
MKKIAFAVIFSCISLFTHAQMFTVADSTEYPFWVFLPEGYSDSSESFPLLVFLHGRSLCGHDLNKVLRYGPLYEIKRGMKIPFVIAAPQLKPGQSWKPDKVDEVVVYMFSHFHIDSNRFSVTGMSLGGYGAFDYTGKYHHKLAASAIVCGGGNTEYACDIKDLPIWLFHGRLDKAVPFSESTKMLEAVQNCGGYYINLTEYPNWGHSQLIRVFRKPELYEWLLKQVRGEN